MFSWIKRKAGNRVCREEQWYTLSKSGAVKSVVQETYKDKAVATSENLLDCSEVGQVDR